MPDNLKKLKDILNIIKIPKEDFAKYFNVVIKLIQQKEKKLDTTINAFETLYKKLEQKLKTDSTLTSAEVKRLTTAELESLLRRFSSKSSELDVKMSSVQKEREVDETKVIAEILRKMPEPIKETAEQLRDKLETLFGKEELKLTVIEELRKELDGLKQNVQNIGQRRLVGGTPHNMTHVKDLTSQCDGTNKTFYVDSYKKPLLLLCPDAPVIYRPNTDYTLANKVLTLTSEVDAPQDGQTLLFMYVK